MKGFLVLILFSLGANIYLGFNQQKARTLIDKLQSQNMALSWHFEQCKKLYRQGQ